MADMDMDWPYMKVKEEVIKFSKSPEDASFLLTNLVDDKGTCHWQCNVKILRDTFRNEMGVNIDW